MKAEKAVLELPPGPEFLEPALEFTRAFARGLKMSAEDWESFLAAFKPLLKTVMEAAAPYGSGITSPSGGGASQSAVRVSESDGRLCVELHNRGVPILWGQDAVRDASRRVDRVSVENLGREGQLLRLEKRLGEAAARKAFERAESLVNSSAPEISEDNAVIRRLAPADAPALSRLFYAVYGYKYVNEAVYYPEKLRAMLEEGRLISVAAALPDGRLAGHVGLQRWGLNPPVYEAAMGLVDPRLRAKGLFGTIFDAAMAEADKTPMQYLFFDFVTNHSLSQKYISRLGACDLALFVGCQVHETQASLEKLGLGPDPKDMDRYTILFSILPRAPRPFGKEAVLPECLGDPLGYLLEPLGMAWTPSPRFDPLAEGGSYQVQVQPAQGAVIFDLAEPGEKALSRLLEEWGGLLRSGCEYAAVEVPLGEPGLGALYEALGRNGFFAAGFVPYRHSDRLAFRFQAIGPAKVAFDQIRVATPAARRLLEFVRQDYERSRLI
ncbi:MAG: hypothetical protein HY922_02145 [Elusimicrobia bacterium]|nr:hypothetical protein [Elusimicrobiota bacterium]